MASTTVGRAAAQSPQFVPAFPLYCRGPLTTGAPVGNRTTTPFRWAATAAGVARPARGTCAWADRKAQGVEVLPGGGNVICDFSHAMKSVPRGRYVEIGVARDPLVNNCLHLTRYLGAVSPPFSGVPALPPFVRQSVATLSAAQITSLRHGIQVMMSRPVTDPTSYRFQANIHGTFDTATTPAEMAAWNQCEHGSYYFFAWHRMYLYFFDRILRAASGDPTLVLPYWNWADATQRALPAAFRQATGNSLYIAPPGRPAAIDAGTAQLGPGTVDFSAAFGDTNFDSPTGSGNSFGGQIAAPMQFNSPHGALESQPHDVVHVALGGLMDDPDTAAQDPIFWLHHANIDRLWNRWIRQGGGRADPGDAAWLNTRFTFYDEAGHAVYLTGSEVVNDVGSLNYRYDDDPTLLRHRLRTAIAEEARSQTPVRSEIVLSSGAQQRLRLAGETARIHLPLTDESLARLRLLSTTNQARTVLLRFEDIQYEKSSGVYYEVYVNPPAEQTLTIHSPGYVGNLSLFGLKPHRMSGGAMASGNPIVVEYDISKLVRQATSNSSNISVVLVPRGLFDLSGRPLSVPATSQGTLGSIRIVLH